MVASGDDHDALKSLMLRVPLCDNSDILEIDVALFCYFFCSELWTI